MPILVTKNDMVEIICKFKGHTVPKDDIEKLKANPDKTVISTCERCNFAITIQMDPEDEECYLVSDYL